VTAAKHAPARQRRAAARLVNISSATRKPRAVEAACCLLPKRLLDVSASALLLVVLMPFMVVIALAIKLESRGPMLYRCRRVGLAGREFDMLKFRKMRHDAGGPALTAVDDDRFTRLGSFLARTKLDELPQLLNVIRGTMSLVGPRPEDPSFVALFPNEYREITRTRPGITGLSQLAFAREGRLLAHSDREAHYAARLLPAKIAIDRLYVARRSLRMDLHILAWTVAAIVLRTDVAVDRQSGALHVRRRPSKATPAER
jgi:lipopolysaccharide/colanic/teichoic acid biosynthesis glycosyltransferase